LGLWATVAELDELALRSAREAAVVTRLLLETADGTAVRFAHALVRQALYEGLLPGHGPASRRVWHRRIGEALAAAPGSDPDAVADHFRQAADPRAADWLLAAGLRAERALAWQAAADRFEAALPLVDAAGAAPRQRALLRYRLALLREHGQVPRGVVAAGGGESAGDRGWRPPVDGLGRASSRVP
jgi:predicted ATPase